MVIAMQLEANSYLNSLRPSEHHIEGKYFPLELHAVHKAADGSLLIVALLVKDGVGVPRSKIANFFLPFIGQVPVVSVA